jgi:von Willebrand factor type A domain/F5/8 type C domain
MKKALTAAVAILVLALVVGAGAYQFGWFSRLRTSTLGTPPGQPGGTPATAAAAGGTQGTAAASAESAPAGAVPSQGTPSGGETGAPQKFDGNVASVDFGGRVESATQPDEWMDRVLNAIDGDRTSLWHTAEALTGPKEIVLSFFGREPALIDGVAIVSEAESEARDAPREIEVFTSMAGPASGFAKVAGGTLQALEESSLPFAPVEARFVKLRFTTSHSNRDYFVIAEIKVHEAQRAGYTSIVARHPEIVATVAPKGGGAPVPGVVDVMGTCTPATDLAPGRSESRKVLVITGKAGAAQDLYPGVAIQQEKGPARRRSGIYADLAIFDRVQFEVMAANRVRPWQLSEKEGNDTVVLEQNCESDEDLRMSPSFKRALVAWVAAGHKLIIHDSDKCSPGPDYSWLPYRLKTNNPGAQGAASDYVQFLEQNWMAHARGGRPGFINLDAWVNGEQDYRNELGDTNTVVEWDSHWCGHMAVRNINKVYGFSEVYAHYGRGLMVYGGYDIDMATTTGYDLMIARELAQGFDPDNLPCSAHLGDFIVTTDSRLVQRGIVPGRSYVYPLKLLSNQGYKGTVNLSLSSTPAVQGLTQRFEPASVSLTALAESTLTVTVPAGVKPAPVAVQVKGVDAAGKTNFLCLQLELPKTGELAVVSDLHKGKQPKNLEIVLDVSGSMKTPLGGKTRWTTALGVLQGMLAKLPDDFNVGLRMYGHRESSKSPNTCTDSQLAVPIQQLDREAVLNAANAVKPKGETPLVYSVLQAPADLKAVGGGTVIVITDGEESCRGDMAKAAAALKASGQDITLNIVGFTLTGQKAQQQLASFAESTGGRFYPASTGDALGRALMIAAIEKFPYSVYDSSGKLVSSGEAGAAGEELAPGIYKVVVEAGTEKLVADRVEVAVGGQTTLHVAVKNGRLVLEQ